MHRVSRVEKGYSKSERGGSAQTFMCIYCDHSHLGNVEHAPPHPKKSSWKSRLSERVSADNLDQLIVISTIAYRVYMI